MLMGQPDLSCLALRTHRQAWGDIEVIKYGLLHDKGLMSCYFETEFFPFIF